jgi:hypothetical protein
MARGSTVSPTWKRTRKAQCSMDDVSTPT